MITLTPITLHYIVLRCILRICIYIRSPALHRILPRKTFDCVITLLHITYYQQQTCGEQLCVALLRGVALQLQLHITSASIALPILCNLLRCVAPAEDVW